MNHSSVHLPLSKQSYRMHIKIDEHLVEGGVGVEEDKDPVSDDLALNSKVILCGNLNEQAVSCGRLYKVLM